MKHPDFIIPPNRKSASTDTTAIANFATIEGAKAHYQIVKERLLAIYKWHEYAGYASADFKLMDSAGVPKSGKVKEGDYFKIDIPAPGNPSGEGYDWVKVKHVKEARDENGDWEYTLIHVQPSSSPTTPENDTAHFFSDTSSSYFLAKREGNEVSAEVHGRNEEANTEIDSLTDKIRNTIISIGALFGFSKAQWKSLVNGLVKKEH